MADRSGIFSTHFLEDIDHWVRTDRRTALRLLRIIRQTLRDPFSGIGKPEPLGLFNGVHIEGLFQGHFSNR